MLRTWGSCWFVLNFLYQYLTLWNSTLLHRKSCSLIRIFALSKAPPKPQPNYLKSCSSAYRKTHLNAFQVLVRTEKLECRQVAYHTDYHFPFFKWDLPSSQSLSILLALEIEVQPPLSLSFSYFIATIEGIVAFAKNDNPSSLLSIWPFLFLIAQWSFMLEVIGPIKTLVYAKITLIVLSNYSCILHSSQTCAAPSYCYYESTYCMSCS